MAFKMKGFPYSGTVPLKDRVRAPFDPHNTAHDKYDRGEGPNPHPDPEGPTYKKAPLLQTKEQEASKEEKEIMDKMKELEAKMTTLEKEGKQGSEEYKKLEEEHRDLDNQLYPYD